ncbi:myo-inosose-2 dehydratase [Paenibacillus sacheonensis]|uniref:Inosose dehydratase n=1 Tax=Paenibacillus sacheonensis TaxID=742054 RepID=A0A7X5C2I7_9BACL|nr:myo-inosose-2 dehydratase [Paenibacillus sacheonensis]MBM7566206.1 inosose dehydratase [Paenibacillus sacheonensis]NBC70414.1 myo-inosose-2 dehydratase [Paenibacillus sacheonensis]
MLDNSRIKLGIAPIAWTNDDLPELGGENTFEQCISEMALAGFEGSEVGNKYPRDPAVLRKYLAPRGLSIASAWFSAFLVTKPLQETVDAFTRHRDFLHAMGARVIVVAEQGHSIQGMPDRPVFDDKPSFAEEEWQMLAAGLHRLGELAQEKEMDVVYHHHMGTGVQTAEEIDKLMKLTDPALVSLLFDTGHLAFSGEDPLAVLAKHADRVKHVHLKDIRADVVAQVRRERLSFLQAVKAGAFTVPGDGAVDFAPVFAKLGAMNYAGWFVVEAEQDPALANPFEYAVKARRFIREQAGL